MGKIAIIGAGISGLSMAHLLKDRHEVVIYEKDSQPGGLIRCKRVQGSLYHLCGGHVFNTKRKDVMDWFWSFFHQDNDFSKAERNSVVFMEDGKQIPYPIENHAYLLEEDMLKSFIDDLLWIKSRQRNGAYDYPLAQINNFEQFLLEKFGKTLYEAYFRPYNEKVWRRDLSRVPISWLEGKLPMPTIEEIIFNNIKKVEERKFVHSTFWYEKQGGSQFIVDTLAKDMNIQCNFKRGGVIYNVKKKNWTVCGEEYEKVVFCGNIKTLLPMLEGVDFSAYDSKIDALESHGTTSVFCEIDKNPYSWIYMPSRQHESHRIICTGNFSPSNNALGKMTGTIEFTDETSEEEIKDNLTRIPLHPKYLAHCYNRYTYPIQDRETRSMIKSLKEDMARCNLYMTGRFADWEYYNMDAAIGAAMDMCEIME